MKQYLKSFIIGSSWFAFIWLFVFVSSYEKVRTYEYTTYSMNAPLFLGFLNVLGLYLAQQLNLTMTQRFVVTGLLGAMIISFVITKHKAYTWTDQRRWREQYFTLIFGYLFIYGIIIRRMEELLI